MAAALTLSGERTVIEDSPEAITAFLRPRPVRELPASAHGRRPLSPNTDYAPSATSPTSPR
ncbi:hypothetical protein [Streptomyces mirabilis]|uniref:hypothetical protein n=1 Tax=Streptomyces mirabilis TaxID=68239 RepID=UPI0036B570C7